ncbi:MAG: hypothetical protein IKO93_08570 [Lentisphaeria bacterium]|nr:hypothetical protein [Lentisphaeria bacterium]
MFLHELMFDPTVPGFFRPLTRQEKQMSRLEKPKPVDAFSGDAKEKLRRFNSLPGADKYLELAIEAVWYHFYGDKDEFNPFGPKYGLYGRRYVYTHKADHLISDGVNDWLWDNRDWASLMKTEPLHVCYAEFIRPLRNRIKELFEQYEPEE